MILRASRVKVKENILSLFPAVVKAFEETYNLYSSSFVRGIKPRNT
jgi:hypothetical protein